MLDYLKTLLAFTRVCMQGCNDNKNQLWKYDTQTQMINWGNGTNQSKCISVGPPPNLKAQVVIWDCNVSSYLQKWAPLPGKSAWQKSDMVQWRSAATVEAGEAAIGRCIQLPHGDTSTGSYLGMADCAEALTPTMHPTMHPTNPKTWAFVHEKPFTPIMVVATILAGFWCIGDYWMWSREYDSEISTIQSLRASGQSNSGSPSDMFGTNKRSMSSSQMGQWRLDMEDITLNKKLAAGTYTSSLIR
jgi:hypothetical protein